MDCSYREFLDRKHQRAKRSGFSVDESQLNPKLHPWQSKIVQWALRVGRAGLFEDCGLGKTFQQLEWGCQVVKKTGGKVLLLCPIAVQRQTLREAETFGIDCEVNVCETQAEVRAGITITNYEKLHHFDCSKFDGVILDESSILKAFTGKTKQALCREFANTPYRLACTATPAPNDRMEIGNHTEFLGVMPSNEMLCRWFINDGSKCGVYRLRKHGERDFWRWVASWAVCISSPSDLGYDGSSYVLPGLETHEHVVSSKVQGGFLFNVGGSISATEVHKEKRANLDERADVVGELVNGNNEAWTVWCDTDYEADALKARIPSAIEVRGSHPTKLKEDRLEAFTLGKERVIITKPEIAGFGLNWFHCHNATWFAGYSYERFYQSMRRLLRYGQKEVVKVHVVRTENEASICDAIKEKERQHIEMQREVAALMSEGMRQELGLSVELKRYEPALPMRVPNWITSKV